MPDVNCMCSFIEIAFGLNLLMSSFRNFRDFGREYLKKKVLASHLNWVILQEEQTILEARRDEYKNLRRNLYDLNISCENVQKRVCGIFSVLAFLTAIFCIIVLYFCLVGTLNWWVIILILPWPLFLLSSIIVWLWYGFVIGKRVKDFKAFQEQFGSKYEGPSADDMKKSLGL